MINISSMFAKSPFKPMRDHMDKVIESIAPLKEFFKALHEKNFSKVEEIQQQISKAEEEVDKRTTKLEIICRDEFSDR